jgi:hypothetical protein
VDYKKSLGLEIGQGSVQLGQRRAIQYINLKLSALGCNIYENARDTDFLEITAPLIHNHQEKERILWDYLCPADQRVQNFLNDYLKDLDQVVPHLPTKTFVLDRHGLARILSLPPDKDSFESEIIKSYRIKQGVLHNPENDRRTTSGVFHVAEGGLAIPGDKRAVSKNVFAAMLKQALLPPKEIMRLPFTSTQENQAETFVSLLLRPIVCPEVQNYIQEKTMEIRFFAPGSLVSNLDFVESIFGNAGDPHLPVNDAGLDVEHWTGHTGCVILAPHLRKLRKKDVGLPHISEATERQKRDKMCWEKEDEFYNDGKAFKLTCRDERGVMVTLIADNYFGYCKKEVKTQISFSSNLYGLTEEEHAGGAIAFPSYDLGEAFYLSEGLPSNNATFKDVIEQFADIMELQPEGYGIDKNYPSIIYVPEDAHFHLRKQSITWKVDGQEQKIQLLAFHTYVLPSGYKIELEKQKGGPIWRLIGTVAEGTLCHKPCTVSGGGKSEISKSIDDAMIQGPVYLSDFSKDMDEVEEILKYDFGTRFLIPNEGLKKSRNLLSPSRSLGSVIKLFTPSDEYNADYNAWLSSVKPHIREIVFVLKRHYKPEWKENWREHFSVDVINGHLGHELKYENGKLVANYLRVGKQSDGSWRIYKLRQDYNPCKKIQVEDDISASIVLPIERLKNLPKNLKNPSVKIVKNCEYRLFQRPDDAINRGYDRQAEKDLSSPNSFLSNYEPLNKKDGDALLRDAVNFDLYSNPVQKLIRSFKRDGAPDFFSTPAHPRIVDGKPSKNPRYLQNRPDLMNPKSSYLGQIGTRFFRRVPLDQVVHFPVGVVLPGRRNNPADREANIPPLALYNPIHYQELPELFIDFICSVTGKSPSTTGFGSEGALTKGPFNAIWPTTDLNAALVSYIVTGYDGFSSAAGYIGPNVKVEHDISLLIPEIWSRMSIEERDPKFLIEKGYLEKVKDFEHHGEKVPASLLGYRITIRFVHAFLGRIFNNPDAVFSPEMLRPEKQDLDIFVEGMRNLVETQRVVAQRYLDDGSAEAACPPLKALLYIMATGAYEGKKIEDAEIRKMFTREYLLSSDWYQERLSTRQARNMVLLKKHIQYLENYLSQVRHAETIVELNLHDRLNFTQKELQRVSTQAYLDGLVGTIGTDPLHCQTVAAMSAAVSYSSKEN